MKHPNASVGKNLAGNRTVVRPFLQNGTLRAEEGKLLARTAGLGLAKRYVEASLRRLGTHFFVAPSGRNEIFSLAVRPTGLG